MAKHRTISDTLRQAAADAGGLREVARWADVDQATLHRFINGHNVRSDQLDRIAEALGYELRDRNR
jgi:predicted transcriptional regulator